MTSQNLTAVSEALESINTNIIATTIDDPEFMTPAMQVQLDMYELYDNLYFMTSCKAGRTRDTQAAALLQAHAEELKAKADKCLEQYYKLFAARDSETSEECGLLTFVMNNR